MLRALSAISAAIPHFFLLESIPREESVATSGYESPPLGTTVILRTLNGLSVHGLNTSDKEERDEEFALGIEPPGMHRWCITPNHPGRDGASRVEGWTESLKSFCFRALRGNHTLLVPLFAPDSAILSRTELGRELLARRSLFISRRFGESFWADIYRCQSHMDKASSDPEANQPESISRSIEAVDFVRLSYQGLEFMTHGYLSLPMKSEPRQHILAIRAGQYSGKEILAMGDELFNQFKQSVHRTGLPENPDEQAIAAFVQEAYARTAKSASP